MAEPVTKEDIKAAVDKVPAEQLETLDRFIKSLTATHSTQKETGETFMEKMRKIRIDAPPDFSRKIDLYLNGEKTLD